MPTNNDAASRHQTSKSMAPYNVVPVADQWTKPYWDGASEHRLMIQRCQSCGYYNHPPVFICMGCNDRDASLTFEQVSGQGTVYSWFVVYHSQVGGFEEKAPYLVAAVEMKEQPRLFLISNILDCHYGEVEMGMPVEVVWERADGEITIPQFRPLVG